jgi:acyl CoA:acetate/3-ketoacid CoA transferase alpha subunit
MIPLAKSKVTTVEEAIAKYCHDGMSVLLPGFVNVGVSEVLIEGLIAAGIKDISVISNNTSVPHRGIGKLVDAGVIKAITCSHIGNNAVTVRCVCALIGKTFDFSCGKCAVRTQELDDMRADGMAHTVGNERFFS